MADDVGIPSATVTTSGARAHARAQDGRVVDHMPFVPASAYDAAPEGVEVAALTWAERVAPGGYTDKVISAGTTIRMTDLTGDACAHVVVFRADQPWERLCVADTLKIQWQAYLGADGVLLSDQGRVLASIITDTSGHHDTMCGVSSRLANEARYGAGEAQSPTPAGADLLLLAAAKHGLGLRDLPPSISFFKGVRVEAESGRLAWTGSVGPAHIEMRAEMDLIVLIANTAHPIDPRPAWACSTLEVLAWPGRATRRDDAVMASPEVGRAFLNTFEDLAARWRP